MAPTLRLHAQRSLQLVTRDASSDAGSVLPSGTRALIGIVVMLSLIVLGFTAWRIHVFRTNRKAKRNTQHVALFGVVNEQDTKPSPSNFVNLTPPQAAKTRDRNPSELRANLGYEPNVIYIAPQPTKVSPNVLNLAIVPPAGPPPYDQSMPKVPKSPRTIASMAPKLYAAKSNGLPRLVIVESTFPPSLQDELAINVGETLRLLEIYEDEWCLVQRVGAETEIGVIPRFCISDKPAVRRTKHVPQLSSSSNVL